MEYSAFVQEAAPMLYLEANGINFAYRKYRFNIFLYPDSAHVACLNTLGCLLISAIIF
jgi:hypothetical protein